MNVVRTSDHGRVRRMDGYPADRAPAQGELSRRATRCGHHARAPQSCEIRRTTCARLRALVRRTWCQTRVEKDQRLIAPTEGSSETMIQPCDKPVDIPNLSLHTPHS